MIKQKFFCLVILKMESMKMFEAAWKKDLAEGCFKNISKF